MCVCVGGGEGEKKEREREREREREGGRKIRRKREGDSQICHTLSAVDTVYMTCIFDLPVLVEY